MTFSKSTINCECARISHCFNLLFRVAARSTRFLKSHELGVDFNSIRFAHFLYVDRGNVTFLLSEIILNGYVGSLGKTRDIAHHHELRAVEEALIFSVPFSERKQQTRDNSKPSLFYFFKLSWFLV